MKVLLIGDYCLDVFVEGECTRLSPERPVPVFIRGESHSVAGMSGNVLANLRSLSPRLEVVPLYSSCGAKIRFVDSSTGHHFLRLDDPITPEVLSVDVVLQLVAENDFAGVVISDYAKGFIPVGVLTEICRLCDERLLTVFADTKSLLGDWSKSAIVKINQHEFTYQLANGIRPWEACQHLIVTKGGQGMFLIGRDGREEFHVPAIPIEVRDGAGCGDSVLAGLVVRYLENKGDLREAMEWASKVGANAVTRRGVVAVRREDVT